MIPRFTSYPISIHSGNHVTTNIFSHLETPQSLTVNLLEEVIFVSYHHRVNRRNRSNNKEGRNEGNEEWDENGKDEADDD